MVEKAVLVSLREFSLERSTARAFAVPFRVLNQRQSMTQEINKCVVLELVPLRGKISSMPTKQVGALLHYLRFIQDMNPGLEINFFFFFAACD